MPEVRFRTIDGFTMRVQGDGPNAKVTIYNADNGEYLFAFRLDDSNADQLARAVLVRTEPVS